MRAILFITFFATSFATSVAAQELEFSTVAVENCIAGLAVGADARACVGASAEACMDTDAGSSTVGMGACLSRELSYWDNRLNAAYGVAMAQARTIDAETDDFGYSAPHQAPALRDMQRAWIPFRDAKCDHARSLWGGGTGGGPATLACLLQSTGAQALYLESVVLDY